MNAVDGASPAGRYRWALLGGVWLVYFCFGLTVASLAPLVGPITRDLGMTLAGMGAVFGAWPLVYIGAALPCGALVDRLGPRWSLFAAAAIIALSAVLRGSADSAAELFGAVALFGVGGPLVSIGAPKLISLWFQGRDRGLAMGVYMTGPALGGVLALGLTNTLLMPLSGQDWRAVQFVYAAFTAGAACAWLLISAHPAGRAPEERPSGEARESQWVLFRRLLAVPPVRLVLAMSVGVFFFNHGLNNWLPQILRSTGMAAVRADLWATIPTVVGIAGSLLIPRFAVATRRLPILLALYVCAGMATLTILGPAEPLIAIGLVLQGVARSSMMTLAILVLVEDPAVGARNAGLAGGLFFTTAEIGGVLGPLTIGVLADLTGGFALALHLLGVVALVLVVLALRLRRLGRRAASGDGATAQHDGPDSERAGNPEPAARE